MTESSFDGNQGGIDSKPVDTTSQASSPKTISEAESTNSSKKVSTKKRVYPEDEGWDLPFMF
jgi:hypothetical protein